MKTVVFWSCKQLNSFSLAQTILTNFLLKTLFVSPQEGLVRRTLVDLIIDVFKFVPMF